MEFIRGPLFSSFKSTTWYHSPPHPAASSTLVFICSSVRPSGFLESLKYTFPICQVDLWLRISSPPTSGPPDFLGFLPDLLGFISDSSSPHSAFLHWLLYAQKILAIWLEFHSRLQNLYRVIRFSLADCVCGHIGFHQSVY